MADILVLAGACLLCVGFVAGLIAINIEIIGSTIKNYYKGNDFWKTEVVYCCGLLVIDGSALILAAALFDKLGG